ncbi:hypothetical protein JOQ06_012662, partial [Pogonophryne albipinna]
MEKAMLDLTPPSMENTPPVLAGVEVIQEQQENPGQAVVDPLPHKDFNPPVSSTPERGQRENTSAEKHCKRLQAENHKLRKQNINLKKKLAKMKKEKERATKSETRAKERATLSDKFKPKGCKKLATERKLAVVSFLTRDENSRLLAGKKDTITKNKVKKQRRVLTKPLTELHALYNSEMKKSLSLSYRHFARRRPFMSLSQRPRIETHVHAWTMKMCTCWPTSSTAKSISELLGMIVCDPKNKGCMDRICAKCCFEVVQLHETENRREVTWEQWKR